jgi:hypothetical protein
MSTGVLTDAGKPIVGVGNTVVTAGGSYRQTAVAYMQAAITPVYDTAAGSTLYILDRADSGVVVQVQNAAITAQDDYYVLQMAAEPTTGTLCLIAYGFGSGGTAAAAWYLSNTVLANTSAYTDRWYVYHWIDANGNSIPDAPDTFALVASGK